MAGVFFTMDTGEVSLSAATAKTAIEIGAVEGRARAEQETTTTSQGIARIRLVSNDTSAGDESFFDDLAIS